MGQQQPRRLQRPFQWCGHHHRRSVRALRRHLIACPLGSSFSQSTLAAGIWPTFCGRKVTAATWHGGGRMVNSGDAKRPCCNTYVPPERTRPVTASNCRSPRKFGCHKQAPVRRHLVLLLNRHRRVSRTTTCLTCSVDLISGLRAGKDECLAFERPPGGLAETK